MWAIFILHSQIMKWLMIWKIFIDLKFIFNLVILIMKFDDSQWIIFQDVVQTFGNVTINPWPLSDLLTEIYRCHPSVINTLCLYFSIKQWTVKVLIIEPILYSTSTVKYQFICYTRDTITLIKIRSCGVTYLNALPRPPMVTFVR